MTVKLSELREGTMIDYEGEVYHKHTIVKWIRDGKTMSNPMYVITDEWTANILSQAFNDKNNDTESFSAPNKGELIENDIAL